MVAQTLRSSRRWRKRRVSSMWSASSVAFGVTLPQCTQPSNWWSNKKSLNQSYKLSKRRHPKNKSRSTMEMLVTWRKRWRKQEGVKEQGIQSLLKMPRWWTKIKMRRKCMLTSSASSVRIWDTLPRGVQPSLWRRFKQLMRGKAMRSNTWARKKRLNQREFATHVGKGDTWHIHVP